MFENGAGGMHVHYIVYLAFHHAVLGEVLNLEKLIGLVTRPIFKLTYSVGVIQSFTTFD